MRQKGKKNYLYRHITQVRKDRSIGKKPYRYVGDKVTQPGVNANSLFSYLRISRQVCKSVIYSVTGGNKFVFT